MRGEEREGEREGDRERQRRVREKERERKMGGMGRLEEEGGNGEGRDPSRGRVLNPASLRCLVGPGGGGGEEGCGSLLQQELWQTLDDMAATSRDSKGAAEEPSTGPGRWPRPPPPPERDF